ncbi:MAG: hypothetical protein ACXWRZ_16490 [Bdellovibrio sp.]
MISLVIFYFPTWAQCSEKTPYNDLILKVIKEIPKGGGYSRHADALHSLRQNITIQKNTLRIESEKVAPTFCSGSTYLVFLKVLSELQKNKKLNLSAETQQYLLIAKTQTDGVGIWGRWNANGPGTARLFYELKLGSNFSLAEISKAKPGDFMKIFWNEHIGVDERGHSVVFTGLQQTKEGRKICFWSSQESKDQPAGMGEKCVSENKIHRAIFSRLEFPSHINDVSKVMAIGSANYSDVYLGSLLTKDSSEEEMNAKVGYKAKH